MTTGRINQVAALRWEAREDQPKPVPTHHPTVQSFSDCQVQIRQSHVERSERPARPEAKQRIGRLAFREALLSALSTQGTNDSKGGLDARARAIEQTIAGKRDQAFPQAGS